MNLNVTKTPLKTYSQDESFNASLEYFNQDDLAARVWINKYALKDSQGNIYELTPNDMHKRIAKEIARVETKYTNPLSEEEIFNLIKDFPFIIKDSKGNALGTFKTTHLYNYFNLK